MRLLFTYIALIDSEARIIILFLHRLDQVTDTTAAAGPMQNQELNWQVLQQLQEIQSNLALGTSQVRYLQENGNGSVYLVNNS